MERFIQTVRSVVKDMILIAVVMIAFMSILGAVDARGGAEGEDAEGVDTALVFVVDASSSMDERQMALARQSHADAITSPEVLDAIRAGHFRRSAFAFVEFSSRSETVVGWSIIDGPESAATFAWRILHNARSDIGQLTGVGEGLATALALIDALPAEPLYRVIDIVGDGQANTGIDPAPVRDRLLATGVTINGMPMLDSASEGVEEYYVHRIIGGPRAFSIPLHNIQDMPMLLRRKLVIEIG